MSIKQLAIYMGIGFLLTSCFQYKKPEKPENLMSKDKMVYFLIDLKLLELDNPIDIETLERQGVNPKEYVYKKHQVDSLQFAKSHNYYTYYSDEYEEIFTRVIDSLERLKVYYTQNQSNPGLKKN